MFLRVSSGLSYKCNSPLYPLAFNELSCLFELIHLLVVMGWAGNFWGPTPPTLRELTTLALLEVEPLLAPTPRRVDSVIDREARGS